jgi:hypothetical protein
MTCVICPPVGTPAGISAQVLGATPACLPTILCFPAYCYTVVWNPVCQPPVVHVQERPMPTDTTLTIRCPYCMAGIDFRAMIAHKDGRFVCRECAHTVRPGVPDYRCTCRPCLNLMRQPSHSLDLLP